MVSDPATRRQNAFKNAAEGCFATSFEGRLSDYGKLHGVIITICDSLICHEAPHRSCDPADCSRHAQSVPLS